MWNLNALTRTASDRRRELAARRAYVAQKAKKVNIKLAQ
jgi:hypothetical protein